MCSFYRRAIKSILTGCITVWFDSCTACNTASKIIGAPLPPLLDIYLTCLSRRATSLTKDPSHPSYSLFSPQPPSPIHQTPEQFLPPGCQDAELCPKLCPGPPPTAPHTWTVTPLAHTTATQPAFYSHTGPEPIGTNTLSFCILHTIYCTIQYCCTELHCLLHCGK